MKKKFEPSRGDIVYIVDGIHGIASAFPGRVEHVTPYGQIVVAHGKHTTRFNAFGRGLLTTSSVELVDAAEYERASQVIEQQRVKTLAWRACHQLANVEPSIETKHEILRAIDAARVAVEKL